MSSLHCSPPARSSSSTPKPDRAGRRILSASNADRDLRPVDSTVEAFLATRYLVQHLDPPLELRIGHPCPELNALIDSANWCIITAFNPRARHAGKRQNRDATRALQRTLLRMKPEHLIPTVNVSLDGTWPDEPGYLFTWTQPEQVGTLARKFGQLGVVCAREGGLPELWYDGLPGRDLPPHVRAMSA